MMKKLSFLFLLITITIQLKATTPIYNKDGIELTQNTIKEKIVFCNALNRNIIVWKSIVTIKNTTQEAVNILRPGEAIALLDVNIISTANNANTKEVNLVFFILLLLKVEADISVRFSEPELVELFHAC